MHDLTAPVSGAGLVVFGVLTLGVLGAAWWWRKRGQETDDRSSWAGLGGAWFVGVCGMVAFYGYDGVLCALGVLAGAAALLKDERRKTKDERRDGGLWRVGIAVVGMYLLIPQMVAAGSLLRVFLPEWRAGGMTGATMAVGVAGALVLLWVVLRGRLPRFWVGGLQVGLVVACAVLAWGVCRRGLAGGAGEGRALSSREFREQLAATDEILRNTGPWEALPLARVKHADGSITVWRFAGMTRLGMSWDAATFTKCQLLTVTPDGEMLVNNLPQSSDNHLLPEGGVVQMGEGSKAGRPLGPLAFPGAVLAADLRVPRTLTVVDGQGRQTVCYSAVRSGEDVLTPGGSPTLFPGIRSGGLADKFNFASLMVALVGGMVAWGAIGRVAGGGGGVNGGTGRRERILGVIATAVLAILAFYVGLGALVGGVLEPMDSNLALPLLARSFGDTTLAVVAAVALCLLVGGAGAMIRGVGQSLMELMHGRNPTVEDAWERTYVVPIVGVCAVLLGAIFAKMNVAMLMAWGLGIAASAFLPAMLLRSWKGATGQGMAASMAVGLVTSVAWVLLSGDVCANVYGLTGGKAGVPFNQPAIVCVPVGFLTIVVVSLVQMKGQKGRS